MNTASRRRLIRKLLLENNVSSQSEIVDLLADESHEVTQATVSRDLHVLGAVKSRRNGHLQYVLPDDHSTADAEFLTLSRALIEFVESISVSANLVVIKTAPGAAGVVAGAIDGAPLHGVLGTIAGDDTLMIVADEQYGGIGLANRLEQIGAG
ncbi:MAG: arginine repressor [Acidimicrobiia bacterium]|nr:arginine repressor [Acidimicrobiia bacterium]MDH5503525.1 arginine repressor [Acidimicrobiia bacterium]